MSTFLEFQERYDLSLEALSARMLERHQSTIRVRKPAVANGYLDSIPVNKVADFEKTVLSAMRGKHAEQHGHQPEEGCRGH